MTVNPPLSQARAFLQTDDAVRIGGYIATLESLGIQFVSVGMLNNKTKQKLEPCNQEILKRLG